MATEPEAHAHSVRVIGLKRNDGSISAALGARCSWLVNRDGEQLPTQTASISLGSSPASAMAPRPASVRSW